MERLEAGAVQFGECPARLGLRTRDLGVPVVMNAAPTALRRDPRSLWIAAALAVGAVATLLFRVSGIASAPVVETFVLVFTSIVVEAVPFILLGAVVSAAIEVYVPEGAFERMSRLPVAVQLPACALGGFAFPVCECGSVPVARRLMSRGLHPSAGIAFMLAAPILNPVVLASTAVAYGGRGISLQMVTARAGLGLIVAVAAGWALGGRTGAGLLRHGIREYDGHQHQSGEDMPRDRVRRFIEHTGLDFFFMARFLVAGAALAAALQTLIPQSIVSGVARTPVVGSLALMGLAFLLSLCSEADAFVAVSLVQFSLSAQLAFLVFGPVLDTKLSFLYGATFRDRFVLRLTAVAVPVILAGSLWFEVALR
jgi:uncharacterized protein